MQPTTSTRGPLVRKLYTSNHITATGANIPRPSQNLANLKAIPNLIPTWTIYVNTQSSQLIDLWKF